MVQKWEPQSVGYTRKKAVPKERKGASTTAAVGNRSWYELCGHEVRDSRASKCTYHKKTKQGKVNANQ